MTSSPGVRSRSVPTASSTTHQATTASVPAGGGPPGGRAGADGWIHGEPGHVRQRTIIAMAEFHLKNFDAPDQVLRLPKLTAELVEVGELTVGHLVTQPGWRWSEHVRPTVGGEWCQARH